MPYPIPLVDYPVHVDGSVAPANQGSQNDTGAANFPFPS